jgi:hypothetical protein
VFSILLMSPKTEPTSLTSCAPLLFSREKGERFDSFQGKRERMLHHLPPFPICLLCYQRDTEGEDEVFKKIPLERTPIFVSVVCVCDFKLPFLSDLQNWRESCCWGFVVFCCCYLCFAKRGKTNFRRQTTCSPLSSPARDRKEKTVCLLAHQTRLPIRSETKETNEELVFFLSNFLS